MCTQIRVKIILGYIIFYLYTRVKIISGYLYTRVRVQIACSSLYTLSILALFRHMYVTELSRLFINSALLALPRNVTCASFSIASTEH